MDLKTDPGWVESAWRGVPWPVGPVTLVTGSDKAALRRFAARWLWEEQLETGVSSLTRSEQRAADKRRRGVFDLLDRVGGVFMAPDQENTVERDITDPVYVEDLITAVQTVNINDPKAVTALVSAYGAIGGR